MGLVKCILHGKFQVDTRLEGERFLDFTFGPAFWLSALFSMVGLGYFMYGKKQMDMEFLVSGVALMGYPYFVGSALAVVLVGSSLLAAPFLAKRFL